MRIASWGRLSNTVLMILAASASFLPSKVVVTCESYKDGVAQFRMEAEGKVQNPIQGPAGEGDFTFTFEKEATVHIPYDWISRRSELLSERRKFYDLIKAGFKQGGVLSPRTEPTLYDTLKTSAIKVAASGQIKVTGKDETGEEDTFNIVASDAFWNTVLDEDYLKPALDQLFSFAYKTGKPYEGFGVVDFTFIVAPNPGYPAADIVGNVKGSTAAMDYDTDFSFTVTRAKLWEIYSTEPSESEYLDTIKAKYKSITRKSLSDLNDLININVEGLSPKQVSDLESLKRDVSEISKKYAELRLDVSNLHKLFPVIRTQEGHKLGASFWLNVIERYPEKANKLAKGINDTLSSFKSSGMREQLVDFYSKMPKDKPAKKVKEISRMDESSGGEYEEKLLESGSIDTLITSMNIEFNGLSSRGVSDKNKYLEVFTKLVDNASLDDLKSHKNKILKALKDLSDSSSIDLRPDYAKVLASKKKTEEDFFEAIKS